jgi:hypothetical protein
MNRLVEKGALKTKSGHRREELISSQSALGKSHAELPASSLSMQLPRSSLLVIYLAYR